MEKEVRLIDAEKLKNHYAWWENGTAEMTLAEAKKNFDVIIDVQPTIDTEWHGHWTAERLVSTGGFGGYLVKRCSVCGSDAIDAFGNKWKYCPFCGAKMDEVEDV